MEALINGFLIGLAISGVVIALLIIGSIKKHRDNKRRENEKDRIAPRLSRRFS